MTKKLHSTKVWKYYIFKSSYFIRYNTICNSTIYGYNDMSVNCSSGTTIRIRMKFYIREIELLLKLT